jgi:hypothetical protein
MPKLTLKKFTKYSKPSSAENSLSKSKLTKKENKYLKKAHYLIVIVKNIVKIVKIVKIELKIKLY